MSVSGSKLDGHVCGTQGNIVEGHARGGTTIEFSNWLVFIFLMGFILHGWVYLFRVVKVGLFDIESRFV